MKKLYGMLSYDPIYSAERTHINPIEQVPLRRRIFLMCQLEKNH